MAAPRRPRKRTGESSNFRSGQQARRNIFAPLGIDDSEDVKDPDWNPEDSSSAEEKEHTTRQRNRHGKLALPTREDNNNENTSSNVKRYTQHPMRLGRPPRLDSSGEAQEDDLRGATKGQRAAPRAQLSGDGGIHDSVKPRTSQVPTGKSQIQAIGDSRRPRRSGPLIKSVYTENFQRSHSQPNGPTQPISNTSVSQSEPTSMGLYNTQSTNKSPHSAISISSNEERRYIPSTLVGIDDSNTARATNWPKRPASVEAQQPGKKLENSRSNDTGSNVGSGRSKDKIVSPSEIPPGTRQEVTSSINSSPPPASIHRDNVLQPSKQRFKTAPDNHEAASSNKHAESPSQSRSDKGPTSKSGSFADNAIDSAKAQPIPQGRFSKSEPRASAPNLEVFKDNSILNDDSDSGLTNINIPKTKSIPPTTTNLARRRNSQLDSSHSQNPTRAREHSNKAVRSGQLRIFPSPTTDDSGSNRTTTSTGPFIPERIKSVDDTRLAKSGRTISNDGENELGDEGPNAASAQSSPRFERQYSNHSTDNEKELSDGGSHADSVHFPPISKRQHLNHSGDGEDQFSEESLNNWSAGFSPKLEQQGSSYSSDKEDEIGESGLSGDSVHSSPRLEQQNSAHSDNSNNTSDKTEQVDEPILEEQLQEMTRAICSNLLEGRLLELVNTLDEELIWKYSKLSMDRKVELSKQAVAKATTEVAEFVEVIVKAQGQNDNV